ncbi:MAG: hypothetical protein JNL94_16550, partial [Planctomycetes bacterium]|nr:hypothetical protein [Planctomycetota bacterium]
RERLRAEKHFARAQAASRRGDARAERSAIADAMRCAPDDVWLALASIDTDEPTIAQERLRALPVTRVFDVEWLESVVELADVVGARDVSAAANANRERCVAAGLGRAR